MDNTPILVACGQYTERHVSAGGSTPIDMIAQAVNNAADDSSCGRLLESIDNFAVAGLTVDAVGFKNPLKGAYSNVPLSVAKRLGISPQKMHYCTTGGNTPQMLVNHFSNEINQGRAEVVLLAGGEALGNMQKRFKNIFSLLRPKGRWAEKLGTPPLNFGEAKLGSSDLETRYGLNLPANAYPLFENALRHHYGRSIGDHNQNIGSLFSGFTKVAANNPHAWFQQEKSAEELVTPSASNRYVAYPYTKQLNSMISVNQAAAVILTSVGKAKALGIASDRWVYLHGCADGNDIWNVTQRVNFHTSPALNYLGNEALSMAKKGIDDMAVFDIYSCFPSAVQVACDEFGIAHDDSRGLSLTGGLPYFGGPGNNYSMHGIVEMVQTLREKPSEYGLLNANGWFLTKHSVGIYSATPLTQEWRRAEPKSYQEKIHQQQGPALSEQATGQATVETYTVIFDKKNQAQRGVAVTRLSDGSRALATIAPSRLDDVLKGEFIGTEGTLMQQGKKSEFEF